MQNIIFFYYLYNYRTFAYSDNYFEGPRLQVRVVEFETRENTAIVQTIYDHGLICCA